MNSVICSRSHRKISCFWLFPVDFEIASSDVLMGYKGGVECGGGGEIRAQARIALGYACSA